MPGNYTRPLLEISCHDISW